MKFLSFFLMLAVATTLFYACGGSSTTDTATTEPADTVVTATALTPEQLWAGETPKAVIAEAATAAAPPEGSTIYTVDAAASTLYWKGNKVAYNHYGTLAIKGGSFAVQGGQLAAGTVEIDMNSIVDIDITDPNDNAKLVGHLKSDDFFSTAAHPTASLVLTGVSTDTAGQQMVSGNLTIKGITHQVTFPATIEMTADGLSAKARFSFDRSKWDVRFGSGSFFEDLGDKLILDDIELSLDLKATPAATASL
ncbi:MAG: hypothetical protein OHK0039_42960 [Bacteroidia bacterium]